MIPLSDQIHALLIQHFAREMSLAADEAEATLQPAAEMIMACALGCETLRYPFPQSFLALMVARVLWTLGYEEGADRFLEQEIDNSQALELYRVCARTNIPVEECWHVVQTDVLRLELWQTAQTPACWTLNLGRLTTAGVFTELNVFQSLQRLLRFMLPGWDSGRMLPLALKGRESQAATEYCRALLSDWSRARGWGHAPEVLLLDLP